MLKRLNLKFGTTINGFPQVLGSAFSSKTQAIFLCYDISSRATFQTLDSWLDIIETLRQTRICIIIGCKSDLNSKREVSTLEGRIFADDHGFLFFEVSSKSSEGCEEALMAACQQIYEAHKIDAGQSSTSHTVSISGEPRAQYHHCGF